MTHTNLFRALGWRKGIDNEPNPNQEGLSLSEVHKSIPVPAHFPFWRKLLAFAGPGFLVAVGYMDPGNWATDLAGGAQFGYALLAVILISNFFAMILQHLSLKLGIATGRDLAQMCRDKYSKRTSIFLWIMAEIMIIACDLAEIIGTAIALNLLFGLPLILGVIITALDVFVILLLQNRGFRWLEAFVIVLISTIIVIFGVELVLSSPELGPVLAGFIPTTQLVFNPEMLYLAIGILGATVMPHNLYLHSAVVQTRNYEETEAGKKEAVKFATIDSTVALTLALFVNAAILIVSAATFHFSGYTDVAEIEDAYLLMAPLLGAGFASILFAVALLAAGQNSTVTATLAGQIIMEGFINLRIKPWVRRMVTRLLAIIPAVAFISIYGAENVTDLLILSQVVLSLQLSFAVFPLLMFTSNRSIMGVFVNARWLTLVSWVIGFIIAALNLWLLKGIILG